MLVTITYFTRTVRGEYLTNDIQVEELLLKLLKYYNQPPFSMMERQFLETINFTLYLEYQITLTFKFNTFLLRVEKSISQ